MTATDLDGYEDDYEFPDLYGAYREHLDRCPRLHLGILTDCVEGARLRVAWTQEDWPGRGASGVWRVRASV
ncbi:hypothetical protein [Streptomyces spectabilis]|uniref:Uncharacterized protein n=1 Tax=Streptomyces spectabilis TaxID=68270 RepID=A0A516RDN3_STRST|nr:hypothetical protein [Streptomyces spectabilis]QDQ13776.1 hypothetical protein FH965_27095 [Streptomyces spectabilis]